MVFWLVFLYVFIFLVFMSRKRLFYCSYSRKRGKSSSKGYSSRISGGRGKISISEVYILYLFNIYNSFLLLISGFARKIRLIVQLTSKCSTEEHILSLWNFSKADILLKSMAVWVLEKKFSCCFLFFILFSIFVFCPF